MTHPKAIIFDLDGTLIDSAPDLHAAANVALAAVGRDALDLATVSSFIGEGAEKLVDRCLRATGGTTAELQAMMHARFLSAYAADSATLTRLYPGVERFLGAMRNAGVAMGLCTNKPQTPADEICQQMGLAPYFATIRGARDDVPRKPAPDMLHNTIADMGVDAGDVLYVGDSHVDQRTAQNAGVRFAFFEGGYLNGTLSGPPPVVQFGDWSEDWLARL